MRKTQLLTVTNLIILLCILAYAAEKSLFNQTFSGYELFYFDNPQFAPWQLVSHMFLHGSPTHLFFNIFGLWMFGNTLETVWGAKKFVFFYLICGLGAAALYLAFNYYQFQLAIAPILEAGISNDEIIAVFTESKYFSQYPSSKDAVNIFLSPVVGASGALYGVLVGFAFLFPNHKIMLIFLPVPIAAKFFVPALLALDIFSEFTNLTIFNHNIAHAAHVGGAITAVILMLGMIKRRRSMIQNSQSYGVWKK